MENPGSVDQADARRLLIEAPAWLKRIIAGNPFYLLSAGLLLYGINQLTTDPKLVGAEFSMLRFNFCALVIYEILLVTTAIALARRGVWYDALLLVGMANLFIIVPFSLISRAVYLNTGLAMAMSVSGTLLAAGKFWAFKRYIPNLNLPGRLLAFGALLLLANAAAPLLFKAIANNPAQIKEWLNVIWIVVLPTFAGLANLLPQPIDHGDSPGQKRWLPLAFYLGWIVVAGCHIGGIGYSSTFDWHLSLLVPVLWVTTWTVYLRRQDFVQNPGKMTALMCIPLLLPLLAAGGKWILPLFASLNFACFMLRFVLKDRSRLSLIQLLGALAILLGGLPTTWLQHAIPGMSSVEWIVGCTLLCFFWLIFLSRDPRVALVGALSLVVLCCVFASEFARLAIQVGLISILLHSLRWEEPLQKGAAFLRSLTGVLWVLLSAPWLGDSAHDTRLPMYVGASCLLVCYGICVVVRHTWRPRTIPLFAAASLLFEPGSSLAKDIANASPGFLAIAASFVLFAFGSVAAFSKSNGRTTSGKTATVRD